jgi:hypothetical protein
LSAGTHLALLRTSSGGRSRGRVGFHEQADPQAERKALLPQDTGVPLSDSSSSLSRLHLDIPPQQQPGEQEGAGPLAIARSSSGGGSGSSKGGLRARSKSGPMLMSLATGAEGDLLSDIMNGPEGVAVPIGECPALRRAHGRLQHASGTGFGFLHRGDYAIERHQLLMHWFATSSYEGLIGSAALSKRLLQAVGLRCTRSICRGQVGGIVAIQLALPHRLTLLCPVCCALLYCAVLQASSLLRTSLRSSCRLRLSTKQTCMWTTSAPSQSTQQRSRRACRTSCALHSSPRSTTQQLRAWLGP